MQETVQECEDRERWREGGKEGRKKRVFEWLEDESARKPQHIT
jgi:hypothetical protein